MDPVIDWLSYKNENVEETQYIGNATRSWQYREQGIHPHNYPSNKTVLENIAEDILVKKPLKIRSCDLPGLPRSTFLMVFSPDGTKVASTHGNHNIYVSELASGKHVRILKGHPRTPWCVAFHPSHTQLIGSGCLGGQVRVWDITNGGSEVWTVRSESVISSLAFHPREQLLVIATYNELYFWDWSKSAPFTKVSTNNINEKVRYVAFDPLGFKLITGITLWNSPVGAVNSSVLQQNSPLQPSAAQPNRNGDQNNNPDTIRPPQESAGSAQDMIVDSYHNLVQRYDSLVRNYQRLFMVRHQLNNTPPPPNMIDRGTDPMETDTSSNSQTQTENTASAENTTSVENTGSAENTNQPSDNQPTPGPSRQAEPNDSGDGDNSSSRFLNLDALSFNNSPSSNPQSPNQDQPRWGRMYWRRSSAFQPLGETSPSSFSFRTLDQMMDGPRLLPNPFSTSPSPQPNRIPFSNPQSSRAPYSNNPSPLLSSTSRTSIFTPSRQESLARDFFRRRSLSPSRPSSSRWQTMLNNDETSVSAQPSTSHDNNQPTTSSDNTNERPNMTTRSSQINPSNQVDAQTINESLDLIRDILRDSGTRLLNLITNMSLSTLASVERNVSRRGTNPRAQSEENDSGNRTRTARPRLPRRVFLSSSSDSDSDQSLEVNIFRTRNSTFRENQTNESQATTQTSTDRTIQPTDRMEFELNSETQNETANNDPGGINVSSSNVNFRVRTQNESTNNNNSMDPTAQPSVEPASQASADPTPSAGTSEQTSEPQPSTSRDNFWSDGTTIPPEEAYRKVRTGVSALQKHTLQLTNLWLRGNRVTMRELRSMWENLRRRILLLHRETGRQDLPSYYTRSLFERCMMLTELSDNVSRTTPRNTRSSQRTEANNARNEEQDNSSAPTNQANGSQGDDPNTAPNPGTSTSRPSTSGQTKVSTLFSAPLRRRLEINYRWRPGDEIRKIRTRVAASNRLAARYLNRPRRDFARAIELSATRHEIRMRAMQVLSVMFNMMMMCLEERGLSQLIINMLRTLKKALALTCLMLMTNRNSVRGSGNIPGPPMNQRAADPLNVVRIQDTDHSEPVNVDGPDAEPAENNASTSNPEPVPKAKAKSTKESKKTPLAVPSTSRAVMTQPQEESATAGSQRWSNRLAVQIAVANRNYSTTARNRRQLYLESRRLKALHRTNPTVYPLNRRKALPPISPHRIPAMRSLPNKSKISKPNPRNETSNHSNSEPVAGPSRELPSGDNSNEESPRSEVMYEFEQRVNLIRIAHMQAVRLRNVNRNRFRRLQAIRLYTPTSMRQMYAIPSNSAENREGNQPQFPNEVIIRETEDGTRPPVVTYRHHIHTHRIEPGVRLADDAGQFHAVLNNVAMPLMQGNDMQANQEGPGGQPQRLPRIHEYLQPIILAQNAMVVDEEGGGPAEAEVGGGGGGGWPRTRHMAGMAGLLDTSIISEALTAPAHRIQAWDFSNAATPDIADSTKNLVVQKCRIHNDASIDISKDGRLLVALLPVPRIRSANHWLGVYSLEWSRLGQCLHTCVLEHSAVSVALSPTARHLAVGLGSRRFVTAAPHPTNNVFALLYRLHPRESSSRTGLAPIKELEQSWDQGFTSLNCLRWAPQPGQGLVYANNTGQLIIMS